ncbi:MAG TPA: ABC transporter ATP-binding protein [Thermomicrobiales bacterium]|jgi:ABC-type multidrug transport system fused ATPase/permease subunit|nr:ABC transporter ATP-binding protein [Thermomicrobiales bacterium]
MSSPSSPASTPQARRLNWSLLVRYLRPWRGQVLALAGVLVVTIVLQLATPLVVARFVDRAASGGTMDVLITLALVATLLAVATQVVSVVETWVAERIAWAATNRLREDLAAHLLHLDAAFHHTHTPGELIERVDGDVGTLARFFSRFAVYVLGNVVLKAGILALLIAVDWRVGLGVAVFVVGALVAILKLRAIGTPYSATERQAGAAVYGFLGEILAGREDIRSSGAGAWVLHRWAGLMRDWRAARIAAGMRGYWMFAAGSGLFGLALAFALGAAAVLHRDGAITLGAVFLIFRYTQMLQRPTQQLRDEVEDLQRAAASLGRIDALFARRSVLVDGAGAAPPPGPLDLRIESVRFGYDPANPVLHDVSLDLPAGRVLGILGRTGAGKSTLVRLVPRFHDPDAGTVRLGGIDLRDVTIAAVRARVGLVPQEAHLFSATLRDNLTLFDPDVPDHRLVAVLDDIGMGDWFRALPGGLDTRLGSGDGAAGLSAGQTQVIACARLLLRDPDVVILDEPSSRLDPATERLVHRALARLLAGRTGLLVAHRLSTFALADDLLVMEGGRVVESGPRDLLAADPSSRYATLVRHAAGGVPA